MTACVIARIVLTGLVPAHVGARVASHRLRGPGAVLSRIDALLAVATDALLRGRRIRLWAGRRHLNFGRLRTPERQRNTQDDQKWLHDTSPRVVVIAGALHARMGKETSMERKGCQSHLERPDVPPRLARHLVTPIVGGRPLKTIPISQYFSLTTGSPLGRGGRCARRKTGSTEPRRRSQI